MSFEHEPGPSFSRPRHPVCSYVTCKKSYIYFCVTMVTRSLPPQSHVLNARTTTCRSTTDPCQSSCRNDKRHALLAAGGRARTTDVQSTCTSSATSSSHVVMILTPLGTCPKRQPAHSTKHKITSAAAPHCTALHRHHSPPIKALSHVGHRHTVVRFYTSPRQRNM